MSNSDVKYEKVKDGWRASRLDVEGFGKTKAAALRDLEETERFLRIANMGKEDKQ